METNKYETFSYTWIYVLLFQSAAEIPPFPWQDAQLLIWIYDNHLPLCIQVFLSLVSVQNKNASTRTNGITLV